MAVVDSSKMRNWQVRDAVAEDIPNILQMIKVDARNSTCTTKASFYGKVALINLYLCAKSQKFGSVRIRQNTDRFTPSVRK